MVIKNKPVFILVLKSTRNEPNLGLYINLKKVVSRVKCDYLKLNSTRDQVVIPSTLWIPVDCCSLTFLSTVIE